MIPMDEISLALEDVKSELILSDALHSNTINAIAFDGTFLYSIGSDGHLMLWYPETLRHQRSISVTESNLLSLTSDLDYLYVGSSLDDASIHVWMKNGMTPAITLKDEYSSILYLTTTEKEIVAGRSNGFLDLLNSFDLEKVVSIPSKHDIALSVIVDSEYLYAGGIDDFVSVFKLSDFGHITNLEGHNADVFSLAIDSNFVYSGSGEVWWGGPGSPRPPSFESSVRVWEKKTWECVKTLDGHTDNVNAIAVDETHIYSVSDDGTLRAYHKSDWTKCVLDLQSGSLKGLVIDEEHIFLAGNDTRIWKIPKTLFQS